MKITFTGKQEKLTASQERKLAMAFARLSKLLGGRGEKGVQVILSFERHLQLAEVRLNFYDQTLVGEASGTDQFLAIMEAVEKLEKRVIKVREKFRDSKRDHAKRDVVDAPLAPEEPKAPAKKGKAALKEDKKAAKPAAKPSKKAKPSKVVTQDSKGHFKPMTVDEALIAMEEDRDYMVFRDAGTNQTRVLIRRRDGKIDLVEA